MHPFDEGFQASLCGQPITANPYPEGSDNYADWEKGWTTENELPF